MKLFRRAKPQEGIQKTLETIAVFPYRLVRRLSALSCAFTAAEAAERILARLLRSELRVLPMQAPRSTKLNILGKPQLHLPTLFVTAILLVGIWLILIQEMFCPTHLLQLFGKKQSTSIELKS